MKKLFGLLLILSTVSFAQADTDPSTYLRGIADKMIADVEKNKAALKSNPQLAEKLVKENLLPVIDKESFSAKTLGSSTWDSMNDKQKQLFIDGYINRVINKYAKGISLYDGQAFEFEKALISKKSGNARVKSEMKQNGAEPLAIYYYLSNESGKWLIYNINVAGTDMSKSYRNQFLPRLNEVGLEQFLKELNSPES
ncbi:MlaC/ttg2D family ABC transporter substrate-binding protein [Aliikangiella sp. IMCC44653]